MSENDPNVVQIHLNLQQNGDTIHVDFAFDIINDDLDSVVKDLILTLEIGDSQNAELKELISEQIRKARLAANSPDIRDIPSPPINPDEDEEIMNDPEYIQLLEQQKRELEEMESRHIIEQQNLAQKLTTASTEDDLLIF
ncbi:hypothetical protein TRFO_08727 [Tritrichomonas foetus]|uniref:Uncharacterized protein n=1 Tax=Tritrichomonas foetus TaxID=1144522 RepID=A0A1J4JHT5_9EUKA|nr:hypothetical protein TRFO_08727 [Tritrichomonas foetus]|eukprot:OHS98728.1 hypothetical protein TRFO_08727 [Tritrichomonas foetus]